MTHKRQCNPNQNILKNTEVLHNCCTFLPLLKIFSARFSNIPIKAITMEGVISIIGVFFTIIAYI